MRAVVVHLTRNIKIVGEVSEENMYGSTVFIYHWFSNTTESGLANFRGSAIFDGVEFVNGG